MWLSKAKGRPHIDMRPPYKPLYARNRAEGTSRDAYAVVVQICIGVEGLTMVEYTPTEATNVPATVVMTLAMPALLY